MPTATEHIGVNRRDLAIAWVLVGIAALGNIAGYLFNLYDKWVAFDEVIHGFTLLAVTLLLGLGTYRSVLTGFTGHGLLLVLMIASFGVAIGAVWEILEWGLDQLTPHSTIKGKFDTIIDLVLDMAGSVVAALITLAMVRK